MWPDEAFQDEGWVEEDEGFINQESSPCLLEDDEESIYQLVEHRRCEVR